MRNARARRAKQMFLIMVVKYINNSQELRPINGQYLSHMCTSVNSNTNQLGLMNYQSVVLTFDTVSYRANSRPICIDVYNGSPIGLPL